MTTYTRELDLIPANRMSYVHKARKAVSRSLFVTIGDFFRRQAALREMSSLTDRELADIGLTRDSLTDVFNHEFASARDQEMRRGRTDQIYAS